ncbi:MAG: glycosyltransferase [Candidatus Thermoplasmatota archaeon]|nr:glycosyltransferase [Candidatus Thermoplasmatota archaeon]
MPVSEKFRLLIFLHTNLKLGAGEEKAILNYAKYFPYSEAELFIIQTDYYPRANLEEEGISYFLRDARLFTIRSMESLFRFEEMFNSRNKSLFTRYLARLGFISVKLILSPFFSYFMNRKTISKIPEVQAILYYDVEFSRLLIGVHSQVRVGTMRRNFSPGRNISNAILGPVYKFIITRMDALHFLNPVLMKNSIVHRERDFVNESGVDTDLFRPGRIPTGTVKFLFVSRLEAIKGVDILLKAFSSIPGNSFELYIAGSGPSEVKINEMRNKDDRIHYLGYLSGRELSDLYNKCDIFVFPTLQSEQHPLVVKEALASGMFVISSFSLKGIFDRFQELGFLEYVDPERKKLITSMVSAGNRIEEIRSRRYDIAKAAQIYDWRVITRNLLEKIREIYISKQKAGDL